MKCRVLHSRTAYSHLLHLEPGNLLSQFDKAQACTKTGKASLLQEESMLNIVHLAAVPVSLLLLIASSPTPSISTIPQSWAKPHSPSVGPEAHSALTRQFRNRKEIQQMPLGVRKMSDDEGEMFFPEYWQFQVETQTTTNGRSLSGRHLSIPLHVDLHIFNEPKNASIPKTLQAPFSLHTKQTLDSHPIFGILPRAFFPFERRDYQCPTDTSDCSSIGRSDSCCPTVDVCQLITDTGQGDVGCCPQGLSCSGEVGQCQDGYQSCPGSAGGGCCIPGYACAGVGCKYILNRQDGQF